MNRREFLETGIVLAGGADGVLLSRKYSEMRLDNLRAAGRAIREVMRT